MDNKLCTGIRNTDNLVGQVVTFTIQSIRSPDNCIRHINVLNAIIDALNTSVTVNYEPMVGRKGPDGWDGVIGDIVNNRSDVGVGTFSATYERFQLARLSPAIGYGCPITFLSGKQYLNRNKFQVLHTFSLDLWVMIVMAFVAIGVIDGLMHRQQRRLIRSITSKTFNSFCIFLSQSSKRFNRICCVRHLTFLSIGLVSILLFTQFFNSNILSNILYDPYFYIDSIDDLVDLIKTHNVTVVAHKYHLTWYIFENHDDVRFKFVHSKLVDQYVDVNDVVDGKIIYINYNNILEYQLRDATKSDIHISDERYFGSPLVLLYAKNIDEKIKARIDSVINILFECGLAEYWNSLRFKAIPNISIGESNHQAISMKSVVGSVILFGSITLFLILEFIFECACSCLKII